MPSTSPPPRRILLVDDEADFVRMIRHALVAFGHEVICARQGREALLLYQARAFDLVLTDLIMPDMEGVELIAALRRANPAVKIIAMSGGGRNQPQAYLGIAQRLGAAGTLAKPFPLGELRLVLAEVLGEGGPPSAPEPMAGSGVR